MKPLNDKVLIKPIEETEVNGIIKVNDNELTQKGKVLCADRYQEIKKGQKILYQVQERIKVDEGYLIDYSSILAIIE